MLFNNALILLLVFSLNVNATSIKAVPAMNFSLMEINSESSIELSDYYGKVIYLDFWASWCSSCAKALPLFTQWQHELGEEFVIISINVDENIDDALAIIKKLRLNYPIAYDKDLKVAKMYSTLVLPYAFIIDKTGNIQYKHIGFKDGDAEKLQKIIKRLLKQSPVAIN
jgi:thiol-disulfide isomerase/thioredoxin